MFAKITKFSGVFALICFKKLVIASDWCMTTSSVWKMWTYGWIGAIAVHNIRVRYSSSSIRSVVSNWTDTIWLILSRSGNNPAAKLFSIDFLGGCLLLMFRSCIADLNCLYALTFHQHKAIMVLEADPLDPTFYIVWPQLDQTIIQRIFFGFYTKPLFVLKDMFFGQWTNLHRT